MKLLSKKWMLIILRNLYDNKKIRFNELSNMVNGISSRTLSKRLKELERARIAKKKTFNETPPRVEYSLTEAGRELIKGFKRMDDWVKKWKIKI